MNNTITINQLYVMCLYQMNKWNWDKHIMITTDDEWNGYHNLFYWFVYDKDEIDNVLEYSYLDEWIDKDKIVLLG